MIGFFAAGADVATGFGAAAFGAGGFFGAAAIGATVVFVAVFAGFAFTFGFFALALAALGFAALDFAAFFFSLSGDLDFSSRSCALSFLICFFSDFLRVSTSVLAMSIPRPALPIQSYHFGGGLPNNSGGRIITVL
jgi:hypothetical protein